MPFLSSRARATRHGSFVALLAAFGLGAPALAAGAGPPAGNVGRGAALYETRCGACHSLDANRVGPAHRSVFGRAAGTAPGFNYSPALKKARFVWSRASLDRWLANPVAMVPGTRMGLRVASAQERADLIAFLEAARKGAR